MDAVNSIYHLSESKALFISLFLFYRDKIDNLVDSCTVYDTHSKSVMVLLCYYFNKYLKVQHKYNGFLIWETFSIMTSRYFYIVFPFYTMKQQQCFL